MSLYKLSLGNGLGVGGKKAMNDRTNYEKMLNEEEYMPDQELADIAYECSKGLLLEEMLW